MNIPECEPIKEKWERFLFLTLFDFALFDKNSFSLQKLHLLSRCKDIWYFGRFLKGRVDGLEYCEQFFDSYISCTNDIKVGRKLEKKKDKKVK